MNAHASPTTFSPTLADSWRIASQDVVEAIRFCRQYRRVINERDERLVSGHLIHSRAYVAACRRWLPDTERRYLECVRTVSLAEAEMTAIGMAFAKASDAWED
jgi:hypothetical protein